MIIRIRTRPPPIPPTIAPTGGGTEAAEIGLLVWIVPGGRVEGTTVWIVVCVSNTRVLPFSVVVIDTFSTISVETKVTTGDSSADAAASEKL